MDIEDIGMYLLSIICHNQSTHMEIYGASGFLENLKHENHNSLMAELRYFHNLTTGNHLVEFPRPSAGGTFGECHQQGKPSIVRTVR